MAIRSDCRVLAVEPNLPDTPKSPDFHLETATGERFYLEATLALGQSEADAAAERRRNEALQAIDLIQSPDFLLTVDWSGAPTQPIRCKKLTGSLSYWLGTLDHGALMRLWSRGSESLPQFELEEHGFKLRVSPVPKGADRGSIERRAIASHAWAGPVDPPHIAIRKSVENKAGRYGHLDAPYVIAVNALSDHAQETDAVDSVFGGIGVAVGRTPEGFTHSVGRSPDGAWQGPAGPKNTRVSAILSVEQLRTWKLAQRRARMIINPWAAHPISDCPFPIDVISSDGNELQKAEGSTLAQTFDLGEGWPE